jgi:hypothetical protein
MAYSTINKPSVQFNTVLYTGTGSSNSLTGVGFQPDWVWIKQRSTTGGHRVYDVIRGATDTLYTNQDYASAVEAQTLTSFNSDGFTVGTDGGVNGSGVTFAAWNWLANGTGVSNTAGSITSTVSANTTAGFSIVSYTGNATNGATVGHGLSSAPQMVITKGRANADNWQVLTNVYSNYSEGDFMSLNSTDAKANSANVSFLPTSTTWQMKAAQAGNTSGTKIAYCFHSVKGFSKFGSYTGNGNADGTFVYTGFKPAFVLTKNTSGTNNWTMCDNKRNTFNPVNTIFNPNVNSAETNNNPQDFVSNGFKCRGTESNTNASGVPYIYMAFAEQPLVGTNNVPATAR